MDSHAPFAIKTVPSFSSFATKQPFLVSALKDIHYQIATRNVCYSLKYHLNWLPKSFFFSTNIPSYSLAISTYSSSPNSHQIESLYLCSAKKKKNEKYCSVSEYCKRLPKNRKVKRIYQCLIWVKDQLKGGKKKNLYPVVVTASIVCHVKREKKKKKNKKTAPNNNKFI